MGLRARRKAEEGEKETKARLDESRKHPLLKDCARRNIRNAYLYVVAFAALANDEELTSGENSLLRRIAGELGLSGSSIDAIIADERRVIAKRREQSLLKECISQISSAVIFERLLRDFDEVWNAGAGSKSELREWHSDFEVWLTKTVSGEWKDLVDSRKREKREAAKQKRAAEMAKLRSASQRKLRKALDNIARDFCLCGTASDEKIDEIASYLDGIEAENVDLAALTPDIIKRVKARGYRESISDNGNWGDVWRLIAMLVLVYTPKYVKTHRFSPDLNGMLRRTGSPGLNAILEEFVENWLP